MLGQASVLVSKWNGQPLRPAEKFNKKLRYREMHSTSVLHSWCTVVVYSHSANEISAIGLSSLIISQIFDSEG